MLDLRELTPEQISRLTDEEAVDLVVALEAKHIEQRRNSIVEYARYMEVPGAPPKLTENDRIALLRKKEAMRRQEDGTWDEPEDVALEADTEELYPELLEIPEHAELILNSLQCLMEEEPVTGPLANGHEGIAPDGVWLLFPPGSAKSTYGSVICPSYVMGRWANTEVIATSYASDLARKFGRRVRHICRSTRFAETFEHKGAPVTVTGDNSAVDQWSLTNGSTYRAVGVLAGVTGNRADLLIIDDPVAGREEAESDLVREKTNVAVMDDLFTRLKPIGAKVLGITTRWHEDDPCGRLLGEQWEGDSGLWLGTDGRWWLVLCCPLLADRKDDPLGREEGERLWPEWFTERHVELAQAAGERAWQSLYQQKPGASEGVILLKRYWKAWQPMHRLAHGKPDPAEDLIVETNEPPKNWTQCVLVYDTAIEDGQDNDYSAMTAWAAFGASPKFAKGRQPKSGEIEEQQNLILLGAWRARVPAVDLLKYVEAHVEFYKPDHIVIEKKASGHQLLQELQRKRPRYVDLGQVHYVAVHSWEPPFPVGAKGKTPRAHSAAILLEQGTVWYMPGQTNLAVIKECAAFPNGKYDDWVDCCTTMLIWSRRMNLLEVPDDVRDAAEDESAEREQAIFDTDDRRLYGNLRSKPVSSAARALYGRAPRSVKHWEGTR